MLEKDCISIVNTIDDIPLSKLVENLGKFVHSIVLNSLIGFGVNVDYVRHPLECVSKFQELKGFDLIITPLQYVLANGTTDLTLPCLESFVNDVLLIVGTLCEFLLQKDGFESVSKKEMTEIHAILEEDSSLSVWTGSKSPQSQESPKDSIIVELFDNSEKAQKKNKKNKKKKHPIVVAKEEETPKESQDLNVVEEHYEGPEISNEIVNACMRCVVGLPCNNPTHSHSDQNFVYKIYGTVGLNECENGDDCYFYNRRLVLSDGRKTNCCIYGHGNDEVKRSCANGWTLFGQGKIAYEEIFVKRE